MSNNQKKKPVFSKLNLLCFRLFAIIAISILIISTIYNILYNDFLSTSDFVDFFFIAQNLLAIILLFVVTMEIIPIPYLGFFTFIAGIGGLLKSVYCIFRALVILKEYDNIFSEELIKKIIE